MSRRTKRNSAPILSGQIAALLEAALDFVPPAQSSAILSKWLDSHRLRLVPPARQMGAIADAHILSTDFLRSQPSASGATSFDRLAKNRACELAAEAPVLAALRQARFRLLRMEPAGLSEERMACDVLSGEALRLPSFEMELLPGGMVFFGRIIRLANGMHHPAGVITPLDQAALAVARAHGAAGSTSVFGNARWAEAVYIHVVRHGTLEIPGVNRPGDAFFEENEEDDHLLDLAHAWEALRGGTPGDGLLQRTRQSADLTNILKALGAEVELKEARQAELAAAFERLLMVMLETVLRRERSGSGTVTLDLISAQIDEGVAVGVLSEAARELFVSLRQQTVHGGAAANLDGPELAKLMQRIQGLRAKTIGQGCTEQEALAAAEKVAELLDRYGLSLGELDFKAQPCEGVSVQTTRRRAASIDSCVPAIAEFFDCRVWSEQPKGAALRYVFFGVRADVAAAEYLYELVERAFETETRSFQAGAMYAEMAGERRKATISFQAGLAQGIRDKLRALQAARDAWRSSVSGRDLVVAKAAIVDDEIAKLGLDLQEKGHFRNRRVLAEAFSAGKIAGERFEYAPAIDRAA
jgi:hypothetical protein